MGHNENIGSSVFVSSTIPCRTSNPECRHMKHRTQRLHGFSEPTATIVWNAVLENDISPYEVVTWNTFPFHPYKEKEGLFSNRTPREEEVKAGIEYLHRFIEIFPKALVVSVGRIAENTLIKCGIENMHVPHPANGGAYDFNAAFKKICTDNMKKK
jgi:hypothetical protein